MQRLAERHLSKSAVESAGLLSTAGIERLFALHDADDTTAATRNTLDAVFNHMIGVQVLYEKLIAADVPGQARARAKELGWAA